MHLNNYMLVKKLAVIGFPVFTKRICLPVCLQPLGCIFNPVRNFASKSDLINSLSFDLRNKVVGNAVKNKFHMKVTITAIFLEKLIILSLILIKAIEKEILDLESWQYPVPKTLTEDQWCKLFSLKNRESRFYYIESISQGNDEEIYPRIQVIKVLNNVMYEFRC